LNLLHLEFTHIFAKNFVGSLVNRASQGVFPIEVRCPEIEYLWKSLRSVIFLIGLYKIDPLVDFKYSIQMILQILSDIFLFL
jgi:hypothetical protein